MKYNPSVHAVERLRERFGILEENAKVAVNEMMRAAKYVTTQTSGQLVYKCAKREALIVVDATTNVIVTVHKTEASKRAGVITDAIKATIARELRKAQTLFRRSYRQHTLKLADVNLEIAELFRNKVRCKHPGTQDIIQQQIDALQAESQRLISAMQTQEREYHAIEEEASLYLRTNDEKVSPC